MDLAFTSEEQAFREKIRAWVRDNLPKDISEKVRNSIHLTRDDMQRWAKILGQKGWLGWGWPKEFGGPGWNAIQKHLFEEETALAGAPRIVPFGPVMVAPVIMAYLAAEVKKVLAATGAKKVVLVGNSRGGYAIRNFVANGNGALVSHGITAQRCSDCRRPEEQGPRGALPRYKPAGSILTMFDAASSASYEVSVNGRDISNTCSASSCGLFGGLAGGATAAALGLARLAIDGTTSCSWATWRAFFSSLSLAPSFDSSCASSCARSISNSFSMSRTARRTASSTARLLTRLRMQ